MEGWLTVKTHAARVNRAGVVASLLLSWPVVGAAGPSSIVGEKAPTLNVKVVAGLRAGESYSLTSAASGDPLAVTFVSASDDMVADFARELDRWAARHRKTRLSTTLVFLGEAGTDEDRLTEIAEIRKLQYVSLAVAADPKELAAWKLDTDYPTNAYLVRSNSKVAKHFRAECPFCDKLPGKVSTALWSMLAAGRGSWGAVAKSAAARAASP
jgi:hypothetical protein